MFLSRDNATQPTIVMLKSDHVSFMVILYNTVTDLGAHAPVILVSSRVCKVVAPAGFCLIMTPHIYTAPILSLSYNKWLRE